MMMMMMMMIKKKKTMCKQTENSFEAQQMWYVHCIINSCLVITLASPYLLLPCHRLNSTIPIQ